MNDDLDAQLKRTDPDRWLSSRFVGDRGLRADVVALYAFDGELARAPKVASNAILGEIRLAWWREALDEIYGGRPVRRHPVADALGAVVFRRAIQRPALESLVDARYAELDGEPAAPAAWAFGTGGRVAEMAAGLLDPASDPAQAATAGAAWALARRGLDFDLTQARTDVRGLSAAAFPAVAHAALIGAQGELGRRLKIMWAVARGQI